MRQKHIDTISKEKKRQVTLVYNQYNFVSRRRVHLGPRSSLRIGHCYGAVLNINSNEKSLHTKSDSERRRIKIPHITILYHILLISHR